MLIEKFNQKLPQAILDAGFDKPTQLQLQTLSIIDSGADVFAVAPLGAGKTTAIVMTVIKKLKAAFEKAPRALIIVPDMERAKEIERLFRDLSHNTDLRWDCIYDGKDILDQIDELYEGTDVVFATPKRLNEIFLRNGININKLKLFILDDAHLLIKNNHKAIIQRLGESLPKCQHLVFTEDLNEKLLDATNEFMPFAKVIKEVTS